MLDLRCGCSTDGVEDITAIEAIATETFVPQSSLKTNGETVVTHIIEQEPTVSTNNEADPNDPNLQAAS